MELACVIVERGRLGDRIAAGEVVAVEHSACHQP
jgi:hypothetical protein